ncbi:MAG: 2-hydroxyacyl-CoA dehydratase [Xanthomonadaceae bacterium]|nr:2-hydroxyacyl-CoA dehydratase [Xanthomonadaceae bacterium]MDE1964674.1 2-hydroxyacyl-CoA dehydratase [Xanthomonadaceae bacterium]
MASSNYDFRQFQAELAALDQAREKATPERAPAAPAPVSAPASAPAKRGRGRPSTKAAEAERMARAREEFLALRAKYQLGVGDVVAFFPEEEGIAYLQALLAQPQPRRRRKRTDQAPD